MAAASVAHVRETGWAGVGIHVAGFLKTAGEARMINGNSTRRARSATAAAAATDQFRIGLGLAAGLLICALATPSPAMEKAADVVLQAPVGAATAVMLENLRSFPIFIFLINSAID